MADFQSAVRRLLGLEGGYQNHPSDSGNYNSLGQLAGTNRGIAAPTLEGWLGHPPLASEMKNLSESTAREIYFARYWKPIRGGEIKWQPVAEIFFDAAAQYGVGGASKMMQRVLNVAIDGQVGPVTIAAINAANPQKLFNDFKQARAARYQEIVDNDPDKGAFLDGWLNRLATFNWIPTAAGGKKLALLPIFFIGLAVVNRKSLFG